MIYKNKYFILDASARKVNDENGKQLRITGNAYLMLEYLCRTNHGTVTEIGEAIDRFGEYNEDDLRQLKYKINSLVGYDIIIYQNHIYSIVGDVIQGQEQTTQAIDLSKNNDVINQPELTDKVIEQKRRINIKLIIYSSLCLVLIILAVIFFIFYKKGVITKQTPKLASIDDMIVIPAGNFIMGSSEEEALAAYNICFKEEGNYCLKEGYLTEYPKANIFVNAFSIDKKEVSNEDYGKFIKANNYKKPFDWNNSNLNSPTQPVVGVSWDDASAYCKWLGKRLPTEAEWEKAARGKDGFMWPWGNNWNSANLNHGKGGIPGYDNSDGYEYTSPVGLFLADVSPYGVLNMGGNVQEWVVDDFNAYKGNDKFIYKDFGRSYKIIKGGAFTYSEADTRSASRFYELSTYQEEDVGFRCAK